MGHSRNNPSMVGGGSRTWNLRNFQKYWRKSMWKFQGTIQKEVEFPRVMKKKLCQIFMGLRISKGSDTILQNFSGGSFGKELLLFSQKVCPQTYLDFFWNSPMFIYTTAQILRIFHCSFPLINRDLPYNCSNFTFIYSVYFIQRNAVIAL